MPKPRKLARAIFLGIVTLLAWGLTAPAGGETTTGALYLGNLPRTYRLHLPQGPAKSGPRPLVIVLHGGGSSGQDMESLTRGGFNTLADTEGFVVVYPDGIEDHWNDSRETVVYRTHRENIDDVAFISALIDYLGKEYNLDRQRLYATGMSNGGMMAQRLACEMTGKLAAIAPVAANLPQRLADTYAPSRPISVLLINGTKDPMVPWEGGKAGFLWADFGRVLSVAEMVKFWVAHDRCDPTPVSTELPHQDPQDGTRVRREVYSGGREGTEVGLYTIEEGGHTWPGGKQFLPQLIIGKTTRDLQAEEVIWNFFKRHALN